MPFQIIRNDITKVHADAIVNTANPGPIIGGGTDRAVYDAAGEAELLAERVKIGDIPPGNIAVTPAFKLPAKYIIHASGPVWIDGDHGEFDILKACYVKSLEKAIELGCDSIAFPLMATGTYGFPRQKALSIAMSTISGFCMEHDIEVYLVVFSRESLELSEKIVGEVKAFIDENYVDEKSIAEYGDYGSVEERRRLVRNNPDYSPALSGMDIKQPSNPVSQALLKVLSGKKLDDIVGNNEQSFADRLFELIDERGLKDSAVYRKANITKQTFSKIRNNPDYHPGKPTVIALALSLKLTLDDTLDLLSRAGYTLTNASEFDLIVSFFITRKNYDIDMINMVLFDRGITTLLGN